MKRSAALILVFALLGAATFFMAHHPFNPPGSHEYKLDTRYDLLPVSVGKSCAMGNNQVDQKILSDLTTRLKGKICVERHLSANHILAKYATSRKLVGNPGYVLTIYFPEDVARRIRTSLEYASKGTAVLFNDKGAVALFTTSGHFDGAISLWFRDRLDLDDAMRNLCDSSNGTP